MDCKCYKVVLNRQTSDCFISEYTAYIIFYTVFNELAECFDEHTFKIQYCPVILQNIQTHTQKFHFKSDFQAVSLWTAMCCTGLSVVMSHVDSTTFQASLLYSSSGFCTLPIGFLVKLIPLMKHLHYTGDTLNH